MTGPIEDLTPPPLFWEPNATTHSQLASHPAYRIADPPAAHRPTQSIEHGQGSPASQYGHRLTSESRIPSNGTLPSAPAYRESHSPQASARFDTKSEVKSRSVTRIGLFGKRKKDPVAPLDPMKGPSDGSPVPQYLLPAARESQSPNPVDTRHPSVQRSSTTTSVSATDSFETRSRVESISTRDGSSIFETDQLEANPWAALDDNGLTHTNQDVRSIASSGPSRDSLDTHSASSFKRPVHPSSVTVITSNKASVSARDLLPSEVNRYSGFCKGAWRLQIGDRKKAMDERQRPGSMYSALKYWQCSRCKFEGRLIQIDKKTVGTDRQILLADGIQFRWEFLFKSHVECRNAASNPLKSTFGCIFCCAEGRGTPTFGGAQSFMDHLQEHRVRLPVGEVLYRMNCLIGDKSHMSEDFDINLEPKEGLTF